MSTTEQRGLTWEQAVDIALSAARRGDKCIVYKWQPLAGWQVAGVGGVMHEILREYGRFL